MLQGAQYIQRALDLGGNFAPQSQWTGWVDGCETRDHVVFDGLDCRLGGVDSMDVRLDQLNVDVFLFDECLDCVRALVVHYM